MFVCLKLNQVEQVEHFLKCVRIIQSKKNMFFAHFPNILIPVKDLFKIFNFLSLFTSINCTDNKLAIIHEPVGNFF